MKSCSIRFVIAGLVALSGLLACGLEDVRSQDTAKPEVAAFKIESRHVDIWSDGTRLTGDLWSPKGLQSGDKLPAVILCHGWGGVRSHFNQAYAPEFATAGYVVLTFNYRGWGTSFGGGHVVYVAALDKRVKCIVSQVPSMDGGWVNQYYQPSKLATQRARAEIDPVPQNINKIGRLNGTPFLSRIAKYHPVEFANHLKIPILIIVAEKEELMDNKLHGERVYNIVKGIVPVKYEVFSGTHFEIYGKGRKQAIKMAIAWFDKHL